MPEGKEVLFGVGDCLGCPKREECPIKSVREGHGFSYDKKQVKMARRRAAEKTAAFKDRYLHRSGVESTMSAFDRLTGVKHLRVRGHAEGGRRHPLSGSGRLEEE